MFRTSRSAKPASGLILALVCLCLAGSAAAQSWMNAGAMRRALIDQPLEFTGADQGLPTSGRITFRKNGSIWRTTNEGMAETGKWRIKRGKLCTRQSDQSNGREICFGIFAAKDGTFGTSNGYRYYRLPAQ